MTQTKLAAATMASTADEVEAAFYDALQHGDLQALMACWADEEDIVCIHPGGERLLGHDQIRASYEVMFEHGTLMLHPESIHKSETMTSAVHSLIERISIPTPQGPHEALVFVTHVFQRTPRGWRLVVHHASPGIMTERPVSTTPEATQVLH